MSARGFRLAGDGDLRRLAAAEIEHHPGRELEARHHEGRIDAALEAVARVGVDAELAAGLGDVERLPERRFDQHVGRGRRAARCLAAHDAGDRLDAALVGDDADGRVERVGLAVEREQGFALAGAPDGEVAVHLGGVEHVQRSAAVVGKVIGDVDQRVDRTQPDGEEPALQPFRRRAVLHAAHQPQPEGRTERGRRPKSSVTVTGQGKRPSTGSTARSISCPCRPRRGRARCRGRRRSPPGWA